jgi:DNA-binding MarR family transcriptional regulator
MSKESKDKLMQEIGALARAGQIDTDLFDEAAAEVLGVNRTDLRVMDVLDRLGPVTAGKLAEHAGLSPGAMTAAIDRLEKVGYAKRVPDPDDRRRILVEYMPKARERAMGIYMPLKETFEKRMSRFTVEQLKLIRDYYELALEVGQEVRARLRERTGQPRGARIRPEQVVAERDRWAPRDSSSDG